MTKSVVRIFGWLSFLVVAGLIGRAEAAELKVLSVESMKPALQELAPAFESSAKHKLKIEYASAADIEKKINAEEDYDIVIVDKPITENFRKAAKIAGGLIKPLAKQGDKVIDASTTNWTDQPLPAKALIDFLDGAKAQDVYKAKGMQPS